MEHSRTWQLRASEARVANSTARSLRTGKAPGRPRQTGQTWVFGSAPKRLAQPQKALLSVRSWTWTSSPMTGSYLARMSGGRLIAVLIQSHSLARTGNRDQGTGNRGTGILGNVTARLGPPQPLPP